MPPDRFRLGLVERLRTSVVRPPASRRTASRPPSVADDGRGVVVLPFGRYYASRADLLTRDGFKTVQAINGVSPFSGVGDPDPDMQRWADAERSTDRVRTEIGKDLAARMSKAGGHFLVVDNTTALLRHREINGRLYAVTPGEATDLIDMLWNADPREGRRRSTKLSAEGFSRRLERLYDLFVEACLDSFAPERIILLESRVPRFFVADDGTVAPTDADPRDARFVAALDSAFARKTGCQVARGSQRCFPTQERWSNAEHSMRRAVEDDVTRLCRTPEPPTGRSRRSSTRARRHSRGADHVVAAIRGKGLVNHAWLRKYFAGGGASWNDLLALAHLEQRDPSVRQLVRDCVASAVADRGSDPLAATRHDFERSLRALRGWRWCAPDIPTGDLWTPQITITSARAVLRFHADGSIERLTLPQITEQEATQIADGQRPITLRTVAAALRSWPVYLERGRRGITDAPRVVTADADELVDSCSWIDWAALLEDETLVLSTPDHDPSGPAPAARTDLSFMFNPNSRIVTISGGLMDQVTRIGLFDDLCRTHGLDLYLDDLLYTWRPKFNGFEASRLAPDLEPTRLTRRISQTLIESFREEVTTKTSVPWSFAQARAWHSLGLREATTVTRDHANSRRLLEMEHPFQVLTYPGNDIEPHLQHPPAPVTFYTTPQRLQIVAASAAPLRRVFDFGHLEAAGLDPDVARTADMLRQSPHVGLHVRRGDYLLPRSNADGWHGQQSYYIKAVQHLIDTELGTSNFDVAIFSDDLAFVEAHATDYGLNRITGNVHFIRSNNHYNSIFDSYLMSLCPLIVGSVGHFASTTSLLAEPPSTFIRASPTDVHVEWRRITPL